MRRYTIHIVLFVLTVASTWLTWGPLYSVPIMLILLGHEMAHYFMSRRSGMRASLPFFLPLPVISPFGTLGAVIRMEGTVPSRKALFDTGIAGPLTSFFLSVPAAVIGLKLSKLIPASQIKGEMIRLADPLLFSLIQFLFMRDVPSHYEVVLHPIAYAGWVGLFVTALNLLPIGQLDGGHIAYALFGRNSRKISVIVVAVVAFIFIYYSIAWFLLLILMILFGFKHPTPLDDQTPLSTRRKLIGGMALLILLLSFTVAPFPEVPSLIDLINKGFSSLLR
jgi:membrane-associated protease RseP (regulator of RpoE activity)